MGWATLKIEVQKQNIPIHKYGPGLIAGPFTAWFGLDSVHSKMAQFDPAQLSGLLL